MENKNLRAVEFFIEDLIEDIEGDLSIVSVVDEPAIESDFKLFNKSKTTKVLFKVNDVEKMEITGPVMIPDKLILRYDEVKDEYYNCWFSKETVKKCAAIYLKNNNHNKVNFQHSQNKFTDKIKMTELWFVENPEMDKSKALGFEDVTEGTWFSTYKVTDIELWNSIKNSGFKGFSVEGDFLFHTGEFKAIMNNSIVVDEDIEDVVDNLFIKLDTKRDFVESIACFYKNVNPGEISFSDYPESAKEKAQKAIDFMDSNPDCYNKVAMARAKTIVEGGALEFSTLKRIASFIDLEESSKKKYSDSCNAVLFDAVGGLECVYWAHKIVKQIENLIAEETNAKKLEKPAK